MQSLDRPVSEIMEREVVTLQQGDRLDLADDIMRLGRIRHLPVLEGDRLVGVLSSRDLLAASLSKALDFEPQQRRAFMRAVEVKEVMTQEVETMAPDTLASEAARRMLKRQIGCVPVVEESGVFAGLVTETDLVRAALGDPQPQIIDVEATTEHARRFEDELTDLRRVRDELVVQLHLGKLEAQELWEKLERRFGEAESRVRALAQRVEEPGRDVVDAARLQIDEIRSGYQRIRELL